MSIKQDDVLAKTQKGKDELASRGSVDLDMRHALILVDGHSTLQELLKKGEGLPHLAGSLEALMQMGLISLPVEEEMVTASELAPQTVSGSATVKSQLLLLANNLLENQAGKVIKKIEDSADSNEALHSTIEGCGKVIRLLIDEKKADTFIVAANDILSRSS